VTDQIGMGVTESMSIESSMHDQHEHAHGEMHFEQDKRKGFGFLFWVCVSWIVINILGATFASYLPLQSPQALPFKHEWAGPSLSHLFGTDEIGRDIFSRVVYGARVSLEVGFGAVAIGFTIGAILGMFAAYRRGVFDGLISLAMIIMLAVPTLILTITVLDFWVPSALWKIIIVIGVLSIPLFYRVIRSTTLSVSTREFVIVARAQGATTRRIITREILPNIMPTALSFMILGVAGVIVVEGTLAYLNLSVLPPTPSWGNMINESLGDFPQSTWLAVFPSIAICLFLMSLNFVGDRMRLHFEIAEVKL
jgi:peptide/nickel transport system permease protein